MLKKIDDFLFDNPIGFQKISETIEYYTHMQHTVQARIVALLCFGYTAAMEWVLFTSDPGGSSLFGFIMTNILVLLVLVQSMLVESLTKNRKFKNPLREMDIYRIFRLLFIFSLFLGLQNTFVSGELWKLSSGIGVTVVVYLLACQSLPPGDRFWSKSRKTVHS
ncbi:MAG: hypothetical protein CMF25_03540 [Kangiellaceae bacterium]|nr:hypothetical protein [Kangiellaceae bacterium]|tara:strand:- start:770 stop:1261 length:492 start_codon:yes stop_codon:yes gene_type:complete